MHLTKTESHPQMVRKTMDFTTMVKNGDFTLVAAYVSAIAAVMSAVVTGVISIFIKRRADTHLETFKSEQARLLESMKADLGIQNKIKVARIDYEYDARKRLYIEVEPLLFSAHLAATSLRGRLAAMVDRIREGLISTDLEKTWMQDEYYQRSTVYRLFLPMTHYRLLSRKMSQLDLKLEPLIGRKFMALGIFADIFVSHFKLAGMHENHLPYEPYAEVTAEERKLEPQRYKLQGLVRGQVEHLVSSMIISEPSIQTPMEWIQFDQELDRQSGEVAKAYAPVRDLINEFFPETHPVLWRALLSFYLLSDFFVRAREFKIDEYSSFAEMTGSGRFDYHAVKVVKGNEDAESRRHFEAARLFIRSQLLTRYEMLVAAGP